MSLHSFETNTPNVYPKPKKGVRGWGYDQTTFKLRLEYPPKAHRHYVNASITSLERANISKDVTLLNSCPLY